MWMTSSSGHLLPPSWNLASMRSFSAAKIYMSRCPDPNFKWIPPLNLLAVWFERLGSLLILIGCQLWQISPTPTDQTSVRSFLGLCNQLAFFVPDYQHHTVLLCQLTGKGHTFLWLPEHQVEFDKLKSILSSNPVVRHFGFVWEGSLQNRTLRI